MKNLLSHEELRGQLGDPDLCIIDARYDLADETAGRAAWLAGHIPGAVHLDLSTDLSGPVRSHGGRHPLPTLEQMTDLFGSVGIAQDSRVVVYDHGTGMFAARVWWMLRYLGFDAVKVLDGGFSAWQAAGLPVSMQATEPQPTVFVPQVRPEMLATRDEMLAALGNEAILVLDARSPERYSGSEAKFDAIAGHIPGAVNHHYARNVEAGHLRSVEDLRELYRDVAAAPGAIAYCGSGVSAALDLLAIDEAGIKLPRLYAGSWSDWSSYEDAPVARG